MMKVILLEKIKRLGDIGELVSVKNGYARNYLFTQKKAVRLTKENEILLNKEKNDIKKSNAEKRNIALEKSKILAGKTIKVIRRVSDDGKLYGAVSNKDIVKILKTEFQVDIPIESIVLDQKIKETGPYDIIIRFHDEIESRITLNVTESLDKSKNVVKNNAIDTKSCKKTNY